MQSIDMLTVLNPHNLTQPFPDVEIALKEPDGLLAIGGCLSPKRLTTAYQQGIFPWSSEGEPILWWSPDPRLVLFPDNLKVSRSLRKTLRQNKFEIRCDTAFKRVIEECAGPRADAAGTWISNDMIKAYCHLHNLGIAHCIEAWEENQLSGGLYGVAIGRVFYGESMFFRSRDASKVAFVTLVNALKAWNYALIDCQIYSQHLVAFGAEEIPRARFTQLLRQYCGESVSEDAWINLSYLNLDSPTDRP